jgi:hypothetical protein
MKGWRADHTAMIDIVAHTSKTQQKSFGENEHLNPNSYQPYVKKLAGLLADVSINGPDARRSELEAALDGQPSQELRKLYSAVSLRHTGTYFTGSQLARHLIRSLSGKIQQAEMVFDPACGSGDLLVACARHLPVKASLTETLKDWGKCLAGLDINSAFIETTLHRLALLAIKRIPFMENNRIFHELPFADLFPNIRVGSGMRKWDLPASPTHIIINPPFSYGIAEKGCEWAKGRVSQAASFIDVCLQNASGDARIHAILPDVLRTGFRYERWREMVMEKAKIRSIEIVGQFDKLTEISVFLLELELGKANAKQDVSWIRHPKNDARTVKDFFDLHVGTVVPFRLDGSGNWCAYADLQGVKPWDNVNSLNKHIRFKGATFVPPFVVIRRTSKPDYPVRCIGTLVANGTPVAVENHFIVALPHDKKIGTCRELLYRLKSDSTTSWMNERIRCRHLTVGALGDLPWWEAE